MHYNMWLSINLTKGDIIIFFSDKAMEKDATQLIEQDIGSSPASFQGSALFLEKTMYYGLSQYLFLQ